MTLLLRDLLDRIIILTLTGGLMWRMISDAVVNGHGYNLLVVFGELMVILFVLISRRARDVSQRWQDWAVGLAGTCAPLLLMPASAPPPFVDIRFFAGLAACGIFMQVLAKASLFRSFGVVAANRGIATGGLYRFIRHPLYASYFVTHLGILGLNATWWNAGVLCVCWCFQLVRIGAEERLLGVDPSYTAYRQRVRWRLVPGVY